MEHPLSAPKRQRINYFHVEVFDQGDAQKVVNDVAEAMLGAIATTTEVATEAAVEAVEVNSTQPSPDALPADVWILIHMWCHFATWKDYGVMSQVSKSWAHYSFCSLISLATDYSRGPLISYKDTIAVDTASPLIAQGVFKKRDYVTAFRLQLIDDNIKGDTNAQPVWLESTQAKRFVVDLDRVVTEHWRGIVPEAIVVYDCNLFTRSVKRGAVGLVRRFLAQCQTIEYKAADGIKQRTEIINIPRDLSIAIERNQPEVIRAIVASPLYAQHAKTSGNDYESDSTGTAERLLPYLSLAIALGYFQAFQALLGLYTGDRALLFNQPLVLACRHLHIFDILHADPAFHRGVLFAPLFISGDLFVSACSGGFRRIIKIVSDLYHSAIVPLATTRRSPRLLHIWRCTGSLASSESEKSPHCDDILNHGDQPWLWEATRPKFPLCKLDPIDTKYTLSVFWFGILQLMLAGISQKRLVERRRGWTTRVVYHTNKTCQDEILNQLLVEHSDWANLADVRADFYIWKIFRDYPEYRRIWLRRVRALRLDESRYPGISVILDSFGEDLAKLGRQHLLANDTYLLSVEHSIVRVYQAEVEALVQSYAKRYGEAWIKIVDSNCLYLQVVCFPKARLHALPVFEKMFHESPNSLWYPDSINSLVWGEARGIYNHAKTQRHIPISTIEDIPQ